MLGGILGFLLCISYILTFYVGIVYATNKKKIQKIKSITEEQEEHRIEMERKQRQLDKSFKNIMAYDVKQAMRGGE